MAQLVTIFDDEPGRPLGAQLSGILQADGGYDVHLTAHKASALLENPGNALVIAVLSPPKEKAQTLLADLRQARLDAPLLPAVRQEILNDVFDVLIHCSKDFLVTPLRAPEVCARVRRVISSSARRVADSEIDHVTAAVGLTPLVGEDPGFLAMKRKISFLAQSECTVLISGETGTGKELCARALHYLSPRADCPFLPVNCGAIPVDLFENELFGHHKGAFTGAWTAQAGLIAQAEGGTLFLDEIEALSLLSQVKLLRFLQDQTYYALGSPRLKQANVRIVASTNVDLRGKILEGTFREDLFQRLAVIALAVPPLRERTSDIPLLADHFWKIHMVKSTRTERHLSPESIAALCQYSWPGNVRELQNTIQHLIVLGEAEVVQPEDLPIPCRRIADASRPGSFKRGKALAIEAFERAYISELLRLHRGNVTRAAQEAKKDRRAFGRLIKKYSIG